MGLRGSQLGFQLIEFLWSLEPCGRSSELYEDEKRPFSKLGTSRERGYHYRGLTLMVGVRRLVGTYNEANVSARVDHKIVHW